MSRSCLVLHIAHQCLLVDKAGSQLFCRSQLATTVVANVDDESATKSQVGQHVVQVAFANGLLERLVTDVADVVVQYAIA